MAKMVIGLIGLPGSGKSTVAEEFGRQGAIIINADNIGHSVSDYPEIIEKVRSTFGSKVITDGKINRKCLSEIVFKDKDELKKLENIVHPVVDEIISREIRSYSDKTIVIESAILQKTPIALLCKKIVLVDAPFEVRLERVNGSRDWTEEHLKERDKAVSQYLVSYNYKINNDGKTSIRSEVEKVLTLIKEMK